MNNIGIFLVEGDFIPTNMYIRSSHLKINALSISARENVQLVFLYSVETEQRCLAEITVSSSVPRKPFLGNLTSISQILSTEKTAKNDAP